MPNGRRFSDNADFDPYKRFIESVPDLLEDARAVVRDPDKSYSYRDVRVGCAAFVIDLEENSITKPARGNVKRGVKEKICAEKKILGVVKKTKGNILGIVLVSNQDVDGIEGITEVRSPTLHSCVPCQHDFHDSEFVPSDMLILTTGLKTDHYQVHLFDELERKYRDKELDVLANTNIAPGFENWRGHASVYDVLVLAEATRKLEDQRSFAELAKMALLATNLIPQ